MSARTDAILVGFVPNSLRTEMGSGLVPEGDFGPASPVVRPGQYIQD
jgi:hypothetical protein